VHPSLSVTVSDVLTELAPGIDLELLQSIDSGSSSGSNSLGLRKLISAAFRANPRHDEAQPEAQYERSAEAFRALRILLEQQYLIRCSSSCTTGVLEVEREGGYRQKVPVKLLPHSTVF